MKKNASFLKTDIKLGINDFLSKIEDLNKDTLFEYPLFNDAFKP